VGAGSLEKGKKNKKQKAFWKCLISSRLNKEKKEEKLLSAIKPERGKEKMSLLWGVGEVDGALWEDTIFKSGRVT